METINSTTVINGITFKTYKHWSYDGNVGIYLIDGVSQVGEVINGKNIFRNDFSENQLLWLKATQSEETLNIILNN